jgi:ring-1,2-phenylacetyl-CoA epoxidase subunit PaaD
MTPVEAAVRAVEDPEYPGLTIADLGILERVVQELGGAVRVELVPTVLGCPALGAIEADVAAAARAAGAGNVEVVFLATPVWSPARIRPEARDLLGREFTVAIRGRDGQVICPVCNRAGSVTKRSDFGPALCRETWWCEACRNPVEVVRSSPTGAQR